MNKILHSCDFLIDHWFFGLPLSKFIRSSQFIALATLLSYGYNWKQHKAVLVNVRLYLISNFEKDLSATRTVTGAVMNIFLVVTKLEHISDKLFWRINYSLHKVVKCDITLFLERFNSLHKWVSCLNWKVMQWQFNELQGKINFQGAFWIIGLCQVSYKDSAFFLLNCVIFKFNFYL